MSEMGLWVETSSFLYVVPIGKCASTTFRAILSSAVAFWEQRTKGLTIRFCSVSLDANMEVIASCPLCNRTGPATAIEEHAATCEGLIDTIIDESEFHYEEDDGIRCFLCQGTDMSVLHALDVRTLKISSFGAVNLPNSLPEGFPILS